MGYALRFALAIALALTAVGCGRSDVARAQKLVDRGRLFLEQNDISQAAEQFKAATEILPDNPDIRVMLADAYVRMGNPAEAVRECEAVLKDNPGQSAANKQMALAFIAIAAGAPDAVKRNEHLRRANEIAAKLLETRPSIGHQVRAQVLLAQRDENSALAEMEKAVTLDTKLGEARLALANLYLAVGMRRAPAERNEFRKKAEEQFRKVIEIDETREYAARMGLAMAALRANNIGRAEAEIQELRKKNPNDINGLLILGECKLRQDDPDGVLGIVAEINKIRSNPAVHGLAGAAHLKKGAMDKAERELTRAVRFQPKNPRLQLMYGFALEQQGGKDQQAITAYRTAVELAPGFAPARLAIAQMHIQREEYEDAKTHLNAIVRLEPTEADILATLSPEERRAFSEAKRMLVLVEFLIAGSMDKMEERLKDYTAKGRGGFWAVQLAAVQLRQGNREKAVAVLKAAVKENPYDIRAKAALGRVLIAAGYMQDGIRELAEAERMAPKSPMIHRERAQAYIGINRPDLALIEYKQARAKAPSDVVTKRGMAALQLSIGQTREAVELFAQIHEQNPKSLRDAVNLASAYLAADRLAEAQKMGEELVAERPQSPRVRRLLALVHKSRGETEEARSHLLALAANDPKSRTGGEIAALDIAEGNFKAAASRLAKILQSNKQAAEDARLLVQFAIAQAGSENAGGTTRTLGQLKTLCVNEKDERKAEQLRGLYALTAIAAYGGLGQPDKARVACAEMDRLGLREEVRWEARVALRNLSRNKGESREISLLHAQIMVARLTGWTQLATAKAERLRRLTPGSEYAGLLLGNLQLAAGKTERAKATFQSAAANGSARAYVRLGDLAQMGDNVSEAAGAYKKAIEIDKTLEAPYLQLGVMAEAAGDSNGARRYYEAAVQAIPEAAMVRNQLAWLLAQKEETRKRALELADEARRKAPSSGTVLDTLGWILHLDGQNEEAVERLTQALKILPRNPYVWYHLGKVHVARRKKAEAVRSFQTVLALAPNFEHAEEVRDFVRKNPTD